MAHFPLADPAALQTVLRGAPVSSIAAAPEGTPVVITGTAAPGPDGPLTGPYSGRPCVLYRTLFVPARSVPLESGLGNAGYAVIPPVGTDVPFASAEVPAQDERSERPFAVVDGTGSVLVDVAVTQVQCRDVRASGRNEGRATGPRGSYAEWAVTPGQPVVLAGTLVRASDGRRHLVPAPRGVAFVSTAVAEVLAARSGDGALAARIGTGSLRTWVVAGVVVLVILVVGLAAVLIAAL